MIKVKTLLIIFKKFGLAQYLYLFLGGGGSLKKMNTKLDTNYGIKPMVSVERNMFEFYSFI